jgi:hypothetical protein
MKKRISIIILFAFTIVYKAALSQVQVTTLQPGPVQGIDAVIRTDFPDQGYGLEEDFIANAWTISGNFFIMRSLLKFDLSSIPSGAIITDAKLSLRCNIYSGHAQLQSGENTSYLQKITSPWQENTVTWNSQPSTTPLNQVVLPTSLINTEDYLNIDVTTLINEMFADQNQNYGFMLKLSTEDLFRCVVFSSSDCADNVLWPKLVVTYDGCNLPLNYFTYESDKLHFQFSYNDTTATSWNWDFGNGYFANVANPEFQYDTTGNYLVCLSVTNNCGSSLICDTIRASNNLGTSVIDLNPFIRLIPNPAKEKVVISTNIGKINQVELFNSKGILTDRIIPGFLMNNIPISLHDKVPGLYLVRFLTDHGTITKKLTVL